MALGADIAKRLEPDKHYAVAIWCAQDVIDWAEHIGVELSQVEVEDVIDQVDRGQSADIGINWLVIESYIDGVVADRKLKEEKSESKCSAE